MLMYAVGMRKNVPKPAMLPYCSQTVSITVSLLLVGKQDHLLIVVMLSGSHCHGIVLKLLVTTSVFLSPTTGCL